MAGGLSFLHAARAAPSQMEETPAPMPRADAAPGATTGREAKATPPAGMAEPGGTPGPHLPDLPEAALSPSKTSWTAFTGWSPRSTRTMPRRLPAVAWRVQALARPTTRDVEKYPQSVQMAKGNCPWAPGTRPPSPSHPACNRCEKWTLSKSRFLPEHSAALKAATPLGLLQAAPQAEQAHLPATNETVCVTSGDRGARGAFPARPECPIPKARERKPAGTTAVATSRSLDACRSSATHLRPCPTTEGLASFANSSAVSLPTQSTSQPSAWASCRVR